MPSTLDLRLSYQHGSGTQLANKDFSKPGLGGGGWGMGGASELGYLPGCYVDMHALFYYL